MDKHPHKGAALRKDDWKSRIKATTEVYLDTVLDRIMDDAEFPVLRDFNPGPAGLTDEQLAACELADTIMNAGYNTRTGEKVTWDDIVYSTELLPLVPQAISNILTMPVDPTDQITPLLTRLEVPAHIQTVSFPSISGLPEAQDMGEAQQYPQMDKIAQIGLISALMGKVGMKISFSEEAWNLSRSDKIEIDLVAVYLDAVRRSLGKKRAHKSAQFLLRQGNVVFDNTTTNFLSTDGRDETGARNGTLVADNLITVWAEMLADGFTPDIIIYHPLAWPAFMRDDQLRAWAIHEGVRGMSQIYQRPRGTSGFTNFRQNLATPLQTRHDPMPELSTIATVPTPTGLPFSLRPIVTPYAFYQPAGAAPAMAHIIIADSSALGYLIDRQGGPTSGDWQDPETDIRNFKVADHFTFGRLANGIGVRVIKGVAVDREAINFRDRFRYAPTFANPSQLVGLGTKTTAKPSGF